MEDNDLENVRNNEDSINDLREKTMREYLEKVGPISEFINNEFDKIDSKEDNV